MIQQIHVTTVINWRHLGLHSLSVVLDSASIVRYFGQSYITQHSAHYTSFTVFTIGDLGLHRTNCGFCLMLLHIPFNLLKMPSGALQGKVRLLCQLPAQF